MKRKIIAQLLGILSAFFLYCSCTKIDTTDLGVDLIPAIDNVKTFETFLDVITDNRLFNDTTRMIDGLDHAVGVIGNDPEFGKTTAAMYASFTPATYRTYPFINPDTVLIDSVVLSLAYTGAYGDTNSVQHFEVRELGRFAGFTDSVYPLNTPEFQTEAAVLGATTVNFTALNDSIFYNHRSQVVRSKNELRIHLDTAWARRFVEYDTLDVYSNDTLFKRAFSGLEVRTNEGASPQMNALAYFNLNDNAKTRLTFYCRIQNRGRTDTIFPSFTYFRNDPHANIVRRTPSGAYLTAVTNNNANDEALYIQSAPGSYAAVSVPGLDAFGDTNRVIHRAELIFEKAPGDDPFFTPATALFIDAINANNDSAFTIRNDFLPTSALPRYDLNVLGGVYRNGRYVFTITRYVQSLVTLDLGNPTLRVYAPLVTFPYYLAPNTNRVEQQVPVILNNAVGAGRVVLLGGGAQDPKRARLRIVYSLL